MLAFDAPEGTHHFPNRGRQVAPRRTQLMLANRLTGTLKRPNLEIAHLTGDEEIHRQKNRGQQDDRPPSEERPAGERSVRRRAKAITQPTSKTSTEQPGRGDKRPNDSAGVAFDRERGTGWNDEPALRRARVVSTPRLSPARTSCRSRRQARIRPSTDGSPL
jgi:hypothetical protein